MNLGRKYLALFHAPLKFKMKIVVDFARNPSSRIPHLAILHPEFLLLLTIILQALRNYDESHAASAPFQNEISRGQSVTEF